MAECISCNRPMLMPEGRPAPTELCDACAQELAEHVLDACVTSWVPTKGRKPKDVLAALLAWEQRVALDPAVSADAAALVAQGSAEHSTFCSNVHGTPLCVAVQTAGLTEAETEGPTGGGGIDHAHTIELFGTLVRDLRQQVARLAEANENLMAQDAVRTGAWCRGNRAEGRSGCGTCPWCYKEARDQRDLAQIRAEVAERDLRRAQTKKKGK